MTPLGDSDGEHIDGCSMWHQQGGDYDRDCPACMTLAAEDQRSGLWRPRPIRDGASMYQAADPLGQWEQRGPGSAEVIEMAAFTVGPYETLCPECHLIHRPGIEC